MQLDENKYIVFKREEFFQLMGELALPPYTSEPEAAVPTELVGTDWDCAPIAKLIERRCNEEELPDAVVIRRQDFFAAPALDGYACAMQVAARLIPEGEERDRLIAIADYFHEQAQLASVEGMKVPD